MTAMAFGRRPGEAAPGEADQVPNAVELRGIHKRFGRVVANHAVDLAVPKGSITGIVGENGAGKSTLVSILYGFHGADRGEIRIDGRTVRLNSPSAAIAHGIGMVHQHFMLVPTMTVLENVMLGHEGGIRLATGAPAMRRQLAEISRNYGLAIDPDAVVGTLPVGLQQRVEILKALLRGARILILDEPTSVLTPQEADRLFDILRALRTAGVTVLLITHKLREIMAVTDHVAVMRRGSVVARRATAETDADDLARLMVGHAIDFPVRQAASAGAPVLQATGINHRDARGASRLADIGFALHAGEIVGIAGVSGNGQSELLALLSGMEPLQAGKIRLGARVISAARPADPAECRRLGLAHIPEDRQGQGLVLPFTAAESSILGYHETPMAGHGAFLDHGGIRQRCAALMRTHDVRPGDVQLRSAGFSGGNQQKIIVARELAAAPRVLLAGQPTRGVDIGAISAIHNRLLQFRDAGCAILLVSAELDEILTLADRILVMTAGRIVGEVGSADADAGRIGAMMAGLTGPASA